mmetsp:Transcript_34326/g.80325  ORF Transcript_34326/g.80325 Transcript_34326/m.80325 type:complete len:455 (-) Transcript_34326:132-1496(-)
MGPPNNGVPVGQLITPMSHVRTSPKWSIRGRKDGARAASATPGPGSYGLTDPSDWKVSKQPAYGFGSSHRHGSARPATAPGPGQYGVTNRYSSSARASPTWGFGSSRRADAGSYNDTPGPGSYVPPPRDHGVKFSMSSRKDGPSSAGGTGVDGPGPGQYYSNAVNTRNAPRFGFGTSQRSRSAETHGPGPGAYAAGVSPIAPSAPKVTMTPRRRTTGSRNSTPGPGQYRADGNSDLMSRHANPPSWGFGAALRPHSASQDTPGPGSYVQYSDAIAKTTPKYSLGGARRDGAERADSRPTTPGPGYYGVGATGDGKFTSPTWVFGTAGRGANSNADGPGPGSYQYDLPDKRAPPQYSMTPRRERGGGADGQGLSPDAPGPGSYVPGDRADLPNLPRWGFGTGQRDHALTTEGPGPGAYQVDKLIGEGPSFSVGSGRKEVSIGGGIIGGQYTQFGY